MTFTLYLAKGESINRYEYTWGRRLGNLMSGDALGLIKDVVKEDDLLYNANISIIDYYADQADFTLIKLWSIPYDSLKKMRKNLLADFQIAYPELTI